MEFIKFIFLYSILLISLIGYGLLFSIRFTKYNNFKNNEISLGYIGIFGIFFSILISYLTNLVTPHNNLHNLIFIILGVSFFIYFYIKIKKKIINKYFLLAYFLSFFSIFYFKSHDDFSYYHLSSIINFTENKIEFGTHYFDIAFNHTSSLFHFHSLFKTYFTGDFFYQIGPLSIIIFVNTILFEKIFKNRKIDYLDHIFYLNIFLLVFINVFFYRLAEHGTDRSAQILFFLTFILSLMIVQSKNLVNRTFEQMIIIFALIISFKSFYILYSILFLFIYLKFFKILDFTKFVKKFQVIYLCFLVFFLMLINNIAASGCFVYPVVSTCFESFFWGYGKENVISAMQWYEVWSKAGATPNYRAENFNQYIENFNWVSNWINNYFFNKVSDFFFGVLLVILIFLITFKIKVFSIKNFRKYIFFYVILLILFVEWFTNHPSLRYGGYVLIYLILSMPIAIFLSNQKYKFKDKKKSIKIIFSIVIILFISRNVNRLVDENKIYNYNLIKNPVYDIKQNYFTMQNRKKSNFYEPTICKKQNSKKDLICKKIMGFNFYYKN